MSTSQATTTPDFLEYCFTFGITTMEGRGFYYPVDTAVNTDGKLYVVNRTLESDTRGVRVTMCTIEGDYFGNFGSYGEGDGQFIWPSGCAVDSQGHVYLSDQELHQVSVYDESGGFLYKFGGAGADEGMFNTPSSLAFDSQDNLYVSDTYNHRIQKLTSKGRFQLAFGSEGDGPEQLNLPWGLTADPTGTVYVADWGNDRIQKYSPDGKHLASYGTSGTNDGEFHRPSSVAVDGDGYIYVADWGNERLQVLDPHGKFVTNLRGQATISDWAQNFLNINLEEAGARSRANLDLEHDWFVDEPHEVSSHIEKYFWSPVSVKLDNTGAVLVTESNRHRIQVYRRST